MRTIGSLFVALFAAQAFAQAPGATSTVPPVVRENDTVKISEHVYVIPDRRVPMVPNVGIVVGSRATLVIDPGMGRQGGEAVLREVQKLTRNTEIYIVNTHFHPEHSTGEAGFPQSAKVLRAAAQQQDIEELGMRWVKTFAERPVVTPILAGFTAFRAPAEIFEDEKRLDLGGVSVRLIRLGPGHTRGDTVFFVEKDKVLFSGDLAMKNLFPAFATPQSRSASWLKSLETMEALGAERLVPAHYEMTDNSTIVGYREYLQGLRARVAELKRQGRTAEQTVEALRGEFATKYSGWAQPIRVVNVLNAIYAELP